MQTLAENALSKWPLTVKTVKLAAHRENAVYRVETEEGVFALRVHRKDYRTDAELQSELQFMAALANAGIAVPTPLASRNGAHVEHEDGVQASVLSWLPGKPLGMSGAPLDLVDRRGTFRRFGHLIASMHNAADSWAKPEGFTRKAWGFEGLLGDNPQWGRFWENPHLTYEEQELFPIVRDKLRKELMSRQFDTGLIHADLVSENILLDGDALRVIDFDDSGFGYRLQDIATALVKHENERDYEDLRAALFEGYQSLRTLDIASVDRFLLIRHLSYVGWIVPRMGGQDGMQRCLTFIVRAAMRARAYMSS